MSNVIHIVTDEKNNSRAKERNLSQELVHRHTRPHLWERNGAQRLVGLELQHNDWLSLGRALGSSMGRARSSYVHLVNTSYGVPRITDNLVEHAVVHVVKVCVGDGRCAVFEGDGDGFE